MLMVGICGQHASLTRRPEASALPIARAIMSYHTCGFGFKNNSHHAVGIFIVTINACSETLCDGKAYPSLCRY
jgi:hypothetical protein